MRIIVILFALFFMACSAEKRLQRKEAKEQKRIETAVETVKNNANAAAAVFAFMRDRYPCANDSMLVRFTRSERDSAFYLKPIQVNFSSPHENTLRGFDTTINGLRFSYWNNIFSVSGTYLCPVIEIERTYGVVDVELTNRLKDSVNAYKRKESNYIGQLQQLQSALKASDKQAKLYVWYLIAAGAVAGILLFMLIRGSLKGGASAITSLIKKAR